MCAGRDELDWDLFPAKRRARALSLFMLGVPVGGAEFFIVRTDRAGVGLADGVSQRGRRPQIILVPLLLLVREPVQWGIRRVLEETAATEAKRDVRGSIFAVLRISSLWWIILSGALLNFNMYALATFLPAFMTRVHGYSVARPRV